MTREIVKVVNGHAVTRMAGTRGFFTVYYTHNMSKSYRTIKAAVADIIRRTS